MKQAKNKIFQEYPAVFEEDVEQGGYTVTIPSLPGCISEGDTFEEAMANIREAAELYLEVLGKRTKKTGVPAQRVIVSSVRVAA